VVSEFHGEFDWRRLLREHRRRLRISQPEVARRSELSLSAIKAYESGQRHPSREALAAIIEALGLAVEHANRLMAGAGYAVNLGHILDARYEPRSLDWFTDEVERHRWPVFVTNEASDVIAANRAGRKIFGVALSERLPQPGKWNLLARASDPQFAGRLENWEETMRFMVGLGKADRRYDVNPERMITLLNDAFQSFLAGDPAYVARLLRLWDDAKPVPRSTRLQYPVRWRHESGAIMSFTVVMHIADIWQELSWHDWIPDDEATLSLLLQR